MAGEIQAAFDSVYENGPSSDPDQPSKDRIRGELAPVIQSQVDLAKSISEGAAAGYVIGTAWTALAAINGTRAGQPGRVPNSDAGTHTDPVVGGTVPNAGEYAWSVSPAGWRRVGDVIDPISIQADLTAEVERATTREDAIEATAAGDHLLDGQYADADVAEDGVTVLIGYGYDGVVDVNDTSPFLDSEFAYVETYNDGVTVMRGIRHDGSVYPGVAASADTADAAWVADREVIVWHDGRRFPITFFTPPGTTNANAYIDGDFAHYLRDDGTVVTTLVEELICNSSLDETVMKVVHFLLYGQSLSIGEGSSPPIHTIAVRPGYAVMYNGGFQANGATPPYEPTPPDNLYALIDATEISTRESPGAGLAWGVTGAGGLVSEEGALVSGHGRGGQSYLTLKKNGNQGGIEWRNLVGASRRARVIAGRNSIEYEVGALHWIQGEADRGQSKITYKGWMIELQQDASDDLGEETVLVIDQISNWTAYDIATSEVPFAQLEVAIENPTTHICVGPKYMLPTTADGVHLTAASSARLGSYHARAINRFRGGLDARPLYCTGASRTGAVIRLHMHVPVGTLTLDTTAVNDPGNNGITWSQTGGTVQTISSIAIEDDDIVVTLSGDPGAFAVASIGIAASGTIGADGGPTTGPRSNFRDTAADLDIDGNAMPNWACHQLVSIT